MVVQNLNFMKLKLSSSHSAFLSNFNSNTYRMTDLLFLLAGLIAGCAIGVLYARMRVTQSMGENDRERITLATKLQSTESRMAEIGHEISERTAAFNALQREHTQLATERSSAEERGRQIPKLELDIRGKEEMLREMSERVAQLTADVAEAQMELTKERESNGEKLALLKDAEEKLRNAFAGLSQEALKQNNASFLTLAKSTLEKYQESAKGDLEKREQAITEVVRPVKEQLDRFENAVKNLETRRTEAYSGLTEQVKSLLEGQRHLTSETSNLVKALRAPATRGRWGEIQLRRVVEMAGMVDHCDFNEQVSETTETGRQRPDLLVKLPGDKCVVVDAKVPLAAYLDALEAPDENIRLQKMKDHARQVREHVKQLSRKSYHEQFTPTPEFVILFLSSESFLYAALQYDPALIEDGITDKVILATPTTLIAMLKAIAYGWRQEGLAKDAQKISELGAELYKRLSTVGEHFSKVGTGLQRAVESYNLGIGSLERNVLTTARRFKDHSVATAGKEIEELEQISAMPRLIQAGELFPATGGELPVSKES
jgi:DNA recombination protein RmuC